MSAEARVQSGSLRWAQPRRYLSQPRQQGRVSAEARVQAGSLRWAQPRRWPLYPWAGSRMTEIPGPTRLQADPNMGPKAPKATRHALRRSNYSFTLKTPCRP